jgi:monoamine oxidase
MVSETDVIIVGAGASGLSAARELANLGLSYTLVEGSHRIGGRAYSEEIAPGVWFDLGCSYLHQAENNPFVAIADQLDIKIGREFGDMFAREKICFYEKGQALNPAERDAYSSFYDQCYETILNAADKGEDVAVADLIDLENKYAMTFANVMAATYTRDLDQISSVEVASFEDGSDVPIQNGYGNLVATWGADIPVSLNTRVERVIYSSKGVSVETSKGTLHGRSVLLTVSTGILASGEIEFNPVLPDWKADAVLGLPTGTLNKVCIHFDEDVFGPDGRGFHVSCNDDAGAAGFEVSVMGQSNDLRKHAAGTIATAWTTDPWTRGSYSCALPGHGRQRSVLARPIEDRLFFAGEATTIGDHACCHGAFNSGIRAAREIRNSLDR